MNLKSSIPFTKMSGTGNDFILIDHRTQFLGDIDFGEFTRAICRRKFSVGADGLILIENCEEMDFRWRFFNADGSSAEMCGNGARCAARFAFSRGIAPAVMRFSTIAGIIEAEVVGDGVRLRMTPPGDIQLRQHLIVDDSDRVVHSINTGVPHAVLFCDNINSAPVFEWGKIIRYHERFQPAGTNVNFVERRSGSELLVRTYERGVEGETLACGTGAVAAALVAGILGQIQPPVMVTTSGGEQLIIHFSLAGGSDFAISKVFLEGPASFIYEGELSEGALSGQKKNS